MAKRPEITNVTVGDASIPLNNNLQRIVEAFDNTLSRDGSSPNQMEADIDLNSNDILNAKDVYTKETYINGKPVSKMVGKGEKGDPGEVQFVDLPPYTAYPTRTSFLNATIRDGIYRSEAIVGRETVAFVKDPFGPILAVNGQRYRPDGPPKPQHFGAVGDGISDDTLAFEDWTSYVDTMRIGSQAVFIIPPGKYLINRPLYIKGPSSTTGPGTLIWESATLICNFNKQEYPAFIYLGDPNNPGVSASNIETFGQVWIEGSEAITRNTPVAIRCYVQGQSIIRGIRTRNWWNTVLDLKRVQNLSVYDSIIYGGGGSIGYRDTSGSQFRRSGTTLNRVSGSFTFQSSDVGKTVSLFLSDYTLAGIIQSVDSPTSVTMNADFSGTDGTDRNLAFGSPAVSTSTGSNIVTLDGDGVNASLAGQLIGIPRAGSNGKTLWATVSSVDTGTKQLTLDKQAQATLNPVANPLTETTEIATPVIMIDSEVDVSSTRISQVRFFNTQIETYRGIAVGGDDAEFVDFISCKFHGVSTSNRNWETYSVGSIWGNRLSGKFLGELDQLTLGAYKFRFADQTQIFHFSDLKARMRRNEKLLCTQSQAADYEGGVISFGIFSPLNIAPNLPFSILCDDFTTNTRGVIPPLQYLRPQYDDAEFYLGPNIKGTRTGNLLFKTEDTWFTPVVDDGSTQATGNLTGVYTRIGDLVHVSYRLVDINTTGLTGGNTLRVSLPIPAMANGARNINVAPVRYAEITTNGNLLAYISDGGSNITFFRHNGTTGMTNLPVSALTSGTSDMFFSISYIAA